MGYYTQFNLTVKTGDQSLDFTPEMKSRLLEILEPQGFEDSDIEELVEGWLESKWYEHLSDMKTFSTFFPEYLFILEGDGEERGDSWLIYFKNGRYQESRPETAYAPFNPNLLK